MKLLLDTHTVIWYLEGSPQLPETARAYIEDLANPCQVSVASLWEMAIKSGLGRLELRASISDLVAHYLHDDDILILGITPVHLDRVRELPGHHKDPFDRLLVAQALVEDVALLSRDEVFDAYGVRRIWSA